MAWLESHQELARHPKTNKFARLAGINIPTAIGHLHLLWWWAMDYAQDGDLSRYDSGDIADAAMWQGEPTALVDALVDARFLDRDGENTVIHDWQNYAGKRLEQLAKDRDRKRRAAGMTSPTAKYSAGTPQEKQTPAKPPKNDSSKFKPPTVDEVQKYCAERQNGLDAEQFVAFYASKGWMVGANKMKDWKQAILTWEKRRKGSGNGNGVIRRDDVSYNPEGMSRFHDALAGYDDDGNPIR